MILNFFKKIKRFKIKTVIGNYCIKKILEPRVNNGLFVEPRLHPDCKIDNVWKSKSQSDLNPVFINLIQQQQESYLAPCSSLYLLTDTKKKKKNKKKN